MFLVGKKKKNQKSFFEHIKIYAFQKHFVVCTNCNQDQWLETSQYEELEQTRATSKAGRVNTLLNATQTLDKLI